MAKILGDAEFFEIWDGVDTWEPVVCLSSLSISDNVNTVESITKCGVARKPGTYTYEISLEGDYMETEVDKLSWAEIKTKLRAFDEFIWRIRTVYGNASTVNDYGTGFFGSLEKTSTTKDEFITFSATVVGIGDVSATDPTV